MPEIDNKQIGEGLGVDEQLSLSIREPQLSNLPSENMKFTRKFMFPRFLDLESKLCDEFKMEQEEVKKCTDGCDNIIELYTLMGMEPPQPSSWFARKQKKIRRERAWYANQERVRFIRSVLSFCSKNGKGSWVKLFKWKFAVFFASYEKDQDIAPFPDFDRSGVKHRFFWDPAFMLGGIFGRQFQAWKTHHRSSEFFESLTRSKFLNFIDSSQQLKKGMPAIPEAMIEKSEVDTANDLTIVDKPIIDTVTITPPGVVFEQPWETVVVKPTTVKVTKENFEEQLRRTIREIFEDTCFTKKQWYKPFTPSTSANYIYTRSKHGAIGALYDDGYFGTLGDFDNDNFLYNKSNIEGLFHKTKTAIYGSWQKYDKESRETAVRFDYDNVKLGVLICYDFKELEDQWESFMNKLLEAALKERPLVTPLGLAEKLKCRVITKGPPLTYTYLKPLQRWLWSVLRRHKVFSLIGQYVTEEIVNEAMGALLLEEEVVSGDYVASTNELRSWVSDIMIDQLFIEIRMSMTPECSEGFPPGFLENLRTLTYRAMTKHEFVWFPDSKDFYYDLDPKTGRPLKGRGHKHLKCKTAPQTEGQLMGSIISFPFLCLANAALCRYAMELANIEFNKQEGPSRACRTDTSRRRPEKYRLTDRGSKGSGPLCPLRVNGDDCIFKGCKGLLRYIWEELGKIPNLRSSMGKTYFSSEFLTINSTIFRWTKFGWKESKYINIGLMKGLSRAVAQGGDDQTPIYGLGTICRELKRSCPAECWPKVKERFIYYNRDELSRFPNIPWFFPEWIGGVGLPIDDFDEHPRSDIDRKVAAYIRAKINTSDYRIIQPKELQTWKIHRVVQKILGQKHVNYEQVRIDAYPFNGENFNLEEESSRVYSLMINYLLLTRPLGDLAELLPESGCPTMKKRVAYEAIRNNSRAWARARYHVSSGDYRFGRLEDDELEYTSIEPSLPCISRDMRGQFLGTERREGEGKPHRQETLETMLRGTTWWL